MTAKMITHLIDDFDNDDKLSYFRIAQATKPRIAEREKNVTTFSFKCYYSLLHKKNIFNFNMF